MHHQNNVERAAHYRREASACAAAALASAIAEIKQAYLDLEQGWLCLAPKASANDEPDQPPAWAGLDALESKALRLGPQRGG